MPETDSAVQINAVRSGIRRRSLFKFASGWISESQDTAYSPITCHGESNVTHGGVNLSSVSKLSHRALIEAFDEPLTHAQVMAVGSPFSRKAA